MSDIKEQLVPPTGTWMDNTSIGPPLFRIICLQLSYFMVVRQKSQRTSFKLFQMMIILGITLCLDNFIYMSRYHNGTIYNKLKIDRSATSQQVDQALLSYEACLASLAENPTEVQRHGMCSGADAYTDQNLFDIQKMVHDPYLRDLYDKHEIFVQTSTKDGAPQLFQLYEIVFTNIRSAFSLYPFILFCGFHHPYQVVARRTVLGSVTLLSILVFYLEQPLDGRHENDLIKYVNSVPFFDQFTYFQISFVLKKVLMTALFPLFAQCSKMLDIPPETTYEETMKEVRLDLTKMVLMLECATKSVDSSQSDKMLDNYKESMQACNKGYTDYADKGLQKFRLECQIEKVKFRQRSLRKLIILALVMAYVYIAHGEFLMGKYQEYQEQKARELEEQIQKQMEKTQIKVKHILEGTGEEMPSVGYLVQHHYEVKNAAGLVTQTTYNNDVPEMLQVGNPSGLKCVDFAVQQMTKGSKARVTCPMEQMVFVSGEPIPNVNSAFVFDLEVLDFISPEQLQRLNEQ